MATATRSNAARKAAITRKARKEQEQRDEQMRVETREQIYNSLTKAEQDAINSELCVWNNLDEEYEVMLNEWSDGKTEEMKESIRTLLRKGVNVKTIIAVLENGHATTEFYFGVYGMKLDAVGLVDDVIIEDEFLGSHQSTLELQQRMWDLTDTHINIHQKPQTIEEQSTPVESVWADGEFVRINPEALKEAGQCVVCGRQLTDGKCVFINHKQR